MVNQEALDRSRILEQEYFINWGKHVDYTVIPRGMSQEKMVKVLERIVETGESILVGYGKIKDTF